MVEALDIHNMDKKLNMAIEFLKRGGVQKKAKSDAKPITEKNIKLISDFYNMRTLEGKSKGTRHREVHMLIIMARMLDRDSGNKINEDVLCRLPKWCQIILKLKEEIENKDKSQNI